MNYRLYKLTFTGPCHFGSTTGLASTEFTCMADTLFSAIACECVSLYGQVVLDQLVQEVTKGHLLFSDLLPYSANALFLPKPLQGGKRGQKEECLTEITQRMGAAKKLKKMTYIPVYDMDYYLECVREGRPYIIEEKPKEKAEEKENVNKFYKKTMAERVNCTDDKPRPYPVEQVQFEKNCGLYMITAYESDKTITWIDSIVASLQHSGIGGERSSGYGKFIIGETIDLNDENNEEDTSVLYQLLTATKGQYMAISPVVPRDEEISDLHGGYYRVLPRSGFVTSESYSEQPMKRNRYFVLAAGSCFAKPIVGQVLDVANGGNHSVHRYGKGLYVRVGL